MVVDHRASHPGGAGDSFDRDAPVSLLEDHAQRRVEQLLAALIRRHPRGVPPPGLDLGVLGI